MAQSNQTSRYFLFEKALIIPDSTTMQLESSAVLYNLALICHLIGLKESASKKIVAAKRLYLLALDAATRSEESALLVSLAIANNLGEIHLQQANDLEEARKCFSLVRNILCNFGSFELEDADMEADYNFFYLNAMVRITGSSVATPAAWAEVSTIDGAARPNNRL